MTQNWLESAVRGYHVDFHNPAQVRVAEQFEAQAFAEAVAAMGAQQVVLFTKCHYGYSYYDTRVGQRHPGLDFDLFGRQVEACAKQGIRIMAYYSVARDSLAYDGYPDWRQRTAQGEAIRLPKGDWGTVCFNSPYAEEVVWPQLREIVKNYPVEGVWWDIVQFSPGACFCPYCLEQMAVEGLDPGDARQHHAFKERSIQRFLEKANLVGKGLKPELAYAANATGGIGRARACRPYLDLLLTEYIPYRHGYLYWAPYGRHMRTLAKPFTACMSHWHKAWTDFGGLKTEVQMQYEIAHALSTGATCLFVDQPGPDAQIWPSIVQQMKAAFTFAKEREAWCVPARGVAEVAILADPTTGSKKDARYWHSVQGACKALLEGHFLFDVIDEQTDFARYRLIILPDNQELSEAALDRLQVYVHNGGRLLATYRAGLRPASGREAGQMALGDVLGISYKGLGPYSRGYLDLPAALGAELPAQPWMIYDRFLSVAPNPKAELLATVRYPLFEVTESRSFSHAQAPPAAEAPVWPAAIVRHQYGQGTGLYLAMPLFRAFWEHSVPQYRTLLTALISDLLGPGKLVDIQTGPSVDVSLMAQDRRLILHLLNYHAERRADLPLLFDRDDPLNRDAATAYPRPDQPYDRLPAREIIEEVPPRYNIPVRLRVPGQPGRAYLAPSKETLSFQFEPEQQTIRFELPELQIHQMVVFEFEQAIEIPYW